VLELTRHQRTVCSKLAVLNDLKARIGKMDGSHFGLDGEPNGFAVLDIIDEIITELEGRTDA
jgi:hypothetical protein